MKREGKFRGPYPAGRDEQVSCRKSSWLAIICWAILAILLAAAWTKTPHTASLFRPAKVPATSCPENLQDPLADRTGHVEYFDVALLTLLCAEEHPGAQNLNVQQCTATLDQWAKRIQSEIERHLYKYRANPAEFENSQGYFRMLMMAVVLYEDFGIRYNPDRISPPAATTTADHFFADSRDLFLHGLCGDRRMGTCSSMPVLCLALGRRFGYPLKLVTTKSHLFIRWESATERFNLEATGRGMNRYDDEHFKHWPFEVTQDEIRADGYLKSLTPAEELALFLSLRGHCLRENSRLAEAIASYAQATQFAPKARAYRFLLADAQSFESRARAPALPPDFQAVLHQSGQGPAPIHDPTRDLNPLLRIP